MKTTHGKEQQRRFREWGFQYNQEGIPHVFDNVDLAYLLKPAYLNFGDFYALNKKQLEKHIKAAPCKVEKSADVASLIGLKPNQCHVKG